MSTHMTRLERVAFGLHAGNIIAAADREGVPYPCDNRLRRAWDGNPTSRERWTRIAQQILSEAPGIDLGAMTGTNSDRVLIQCQPRHCRTPAQRALDTATWVLTALLAGMAGAGFGYYFANL